jgi:hypothetical protein
LIQTLLWVGLFAAIGYRFHNQIAGLIEALRRRLEGGATREEKTVEIGADLRPLPPEEQRQRLEQEVSEIVSAEAGAVLQDTPLLRSRVAQAKDLALCGIQVAYNVPVQRQLRYGPNLRFDGFFVKGSSEYIVEVKYCRPRTNPVRLAEIAQSLSGKITHYGWRNVRIVLAVVFDDSSVDLVAEKRGILESLEIISAKIDLVCNNFETLADQFGVGSQRA